MADNPTGFARRAVIAMGLVVPVLAHAETAQAAEIGSRAWFEAYIDAFNRNDFAGFAAYYAPNVTFMGQGGSFSSAAEVLAFYRAVKARVDEQLELLSFVGSPTRIAAEIKTVLHAREDWPDFPTGPLARGQRRGSINFIHYDIEGGRFTRIRSARFRSLPNG
ncbi:nuclear transport factor 2 family protein [Sphingomonas baiyangensis]|nr:nuclear transport factor 2 family protein [Sphingomonas baiyangensis]